MKCKHITINKKYKVFIVFENGNSLVGKTLECYIKESLATDSVLFKLTVDNEGIIILDEAEGKFAINIHSNETDIEANEGFYSIVEIEKDYPLQERQVIMYGNVTFIKGVIE